MAMPHYKHLSIVLAIFLITYAPDSHAFFGILISAAIGAVAAKVTLGIAAAAAFKMFAVNAIGGLVLSALSPKPKIPNVSIPDFPIMTNASGTVQSHVWIYGSCRVGGVRLYDEATDNNKYLWRILALAGHELNAINNIYAFDEQLTLDSSGNVTAPSKWAGKIKIIKYLGSDSQNVDGGLQIASAGLWTSNHRLQGIACLLIRLEFDADAFPNGIPTFTADVQGRKVLDTRTSTTAYSNNWALCLRDLIANHPELHGKINNVNSASVTTAANISDENVTLASGGTQKRYTCNGAINLNGVSAKDIIEGMLRAGAGDAWISDGEWHIKAGKLTSSIKTITQDDIVSPITMQSAVGRAERYNTIRGTFRGSETLWQWSDYPEIASSVFLNEDNNVTSVLDRDLEFVTDSARAQRIAKILLYRQREEIAVQLSVNLTGFDLTVGDVISLTYPRFGWSAKLFEVRKWTYKINTGDALIVELTLRETSAGVYDWNADETSFSANNTVLPSPWLTEVPSITLSEYINTINQEVFGVLKVALSVSDAARVSTYEVEIRQTAGTGDWVQLGSGVSNVYEWHVVSPSNIDVRARTVSHLGVKSAWSQKLNASIQLLAQPPDNVMNFTELQLGDSLYLTWDPVSNQDLSHYEIRFTSNLKGTFDLAQVAVSKIARPATSTVLPVEVGRYFIVAVDKFGRRSVDAASIAITSDTTVARSVIKSILESPTFAGTKTGLSVVTRSAVKYLQLTSSATKNSGLYLFSNTIDLGVRRKSILRAIIEQVGYSTVTTKFDSLPGKLDDLQGKWDDLGTTVANQDAIISNLEYRATISDPTIAETETFGSWSLSTATPGSPSNLNALTPGSDKYITSNFATNNAPGNAACYVACFRHNGITYQLAVSGTNRYWRKYTSPGGAVGQGGFSGVQGASEAQGQATTGSGTESDPYVITDPTSYISSSSLDLLSLITKQGLTSTYFKYTIPSNRGSGTHTMRLNVWPSNANVDTYVTFAGGTETQITGIFNRSATDTGAAGGEEVKFRIQPKTTNDANALTILNWYGNAWPALLPSAPAKPTGFAVTPQNTGVQLDWDNPSDSTITKYQFKLGNANWTDMVNSGSSTVTYLIGSLTNGTSYSVKIRAINANGNGTESDSITFTPSSSATDYWSTWLTTPQSWMNTLASNANSDVQGGFVKHGNTNSPAQRGGADSAENMHWLVLWRPSATEQRAGRYYSSSAYKWTRTITPSIVWSPWSELKPGTVDARGFEFRLNLGTNQVNVTPSVFRLGAEILVNSIIQTGEAVTSGTASGGKTVTFPSAYSVTPNIIITPSNMASGDYYQITSRSKTSFTIVFKNSSNAVVNRTFDWIARGA